MVSFFISLFFLLPSFLNLDDIRLLYKEATQSQDKAVALEQKLETINYESKPIFIAYKGAAIALNAQYEKGVRNKVKMFNVGKQYIEHAVANDSLSLEVRWVRLTIQENTPKILKYKSNLNQDKDFILKHFYREKSTTVKAMVKDYARHSKLFTEQDLLRLE